MNKIVDLTPYTINGQEYFDLRQFALLTGRAVSHISILFSRGNKTRRLKGIRMAGKPFIEVREVVEFPFDSRQKSEPADVQD